jgi:protein SCO1/2
VPERPEFVLRDTSGNRFDFREETAGQPTYVYFGYTNCPDECPTAMADIAAALRRAILSCATP